MALAVDAVVGRKEDVVDLPERGDGLVEAEAECGEVADRGLRHSPPGSNGDDLEAPPTLAERDLDGSWDFVPSGVPPSFSLRDVRSDSGSDDD